MRYTNWRILYLLTLLWRSIRHATYFSARMCLWGLVHTAHNFGPHGGSGPHLMHNSGRQGTHTPNGISICSAVSAQHKLIKQPQVHYSGGRTSRCSVLCSLLSRRHSRFLSISANVSTVIQSLRFTLRLVTRVTRAHSRIVSRNVSQRLFGWLPSVSWLCTHLYSSKKNGSM